MQFGYDLAKWQINLDKHVVDFLSLVAVFDDPKRLGGLVNIKKTFLQGRQMTENNKSTGIQMPDGFEKSQLDLLAKEKSTNYTDTQELNDDWFMQAKRAADVPIKKQVSLRIDEDILDFFKLQGSRYQTKMHAVLRAYVDTSRHQKTRQAAAKYVDKSTQK